VKCQRLTCKLPATWVRWDVIAHRNGTEEHLSAYLCDEHEERMHDMPAKRGTIRGGRSPLGE
jgi:hypothetical protein